MPRRYFTRWLVIIVAAALLAGCGELRPIGSRTDLIVYAVKPGDTMYSIAWRYGYDHREIAAWNSIPRPYTIYVGQELLIIPPYQATAREPQRKSPVRSTAASTASAALPQGAVIGRAPTPVTSNTTNKPPTPVPGKVEKNGQHLQRSNIDWRWPTSGTLRTSFGPNSGRKGLDIAGKLGQPVLAAASGKVVYSGNGLIGYGNLVIIKHDAHYLSAYGHNHRLLVKEGSTVKQGEKIAEMGDSGKEGVVLHFEIRHDGKPVDPLRYLPKQGS